MSDRIRFLEPEQVKAFEREGAVGLRIEIVGEQTILNAQVRRVFPLSNPLDYLSIRDGAGKEVGVLRTMQGLEPETYRLFESDLERRYFTPIIERIDVMKMEAGMWHFQTQTQRGPSEFYVRNWRDSAFELSPNRWHINTVDGGRYEIRDVEALDVKSRKLMDQVL